MPAALTNSRRFIVYTPSFDELRRTLGTIQGTFMDQFGLHFVSVKVVEEVKKNMQIAKPATQLEPLSK